MLKKGVEREMWHFRAFSEQSRTREMLFVVNEHLDCSV